MVTMLWLILLSLLHILEHIDTKEAACLAKFDIQSTCPHCCYGRPLATNNNTRSVVDCSSLCSKDPECRSFEYNPINRECRTNSEKMTQTSSSCELLVKYGEMKKATCRGHWLFEPCDNDADCLVVNSSCLEGRCECSFGHPYENRTDPCPAVCSKYGHTFREVEYYIKENIPFVYKRIDFEECKARCISVTNFLCSFVEFQFRARVCNLSNFTALTAANSVIRGSWNDWIMSARNCA